jgi:hypothetical protein
MQQPMFVHRLIAALAAVAVLVLLVVVPCHATEFVPDQTPHPPVTGAPEDIPGDARAVEQQVPAPKVAMRPAPVEQFNTPTHSVEINIIDDVDMSILNTKDAKSAGPAWQYEDDPFRRCAMKALAGEYGELDDWQRDAYIWGLKTGVKCKGVAKVTSYGPWEPCGTIVASGGRVHLRGCAANPEIPFGTLIWTPYGLRYVIDRGGWVKVGYARVYGRYKRVTNQREIANIDYYTMREWETMRNAPFAVVKQSGDRTVWWVSPNRRRGG